jgi:hypothetical protein
MGDIIDFQERITLRRILSAAVELQKGLDGLAEREDVPDVLRPFLGRSKRDWDELSPSALYSEVDVMFREADNWISKVTIANG